MTGRATSRTQQQQRIERLATVGLGHYRRENTRLDDTE